jgi:hypothetical protein
VITCNYLTAASRPVTCCFAVHGVLGVAVVSPFTAVGKQQPPAAVPTSANDLAAGGGPRIIRRSEVGPDGSGHVGLYITHSNSSSA